MVIILENSDLSLSKVLFVSFSKSISKTAKSKNSSTFSYACFWSLVKKSFGEVVK
ncbi:hypothetical protein RNN91_04555 [Mycoplasmopsis felis]|nr:hypothetical protein [Mycoplasmopsis felis]WQQ01597.1 hypothetical protein RRG54_03340 [Mycoplasmopsis felis]